MPVVRPAAFASILLAWGSFSAAQVQEAPPAPRFDIQTFAVDGNTLLPESEVERVLIPHMGAGRDFGDVQRALEALQDAYLQRGYAAVRVMIPEQELAGGQVRLQVIEARVRNLRVEGNRFFDEANIRRSMPSLKPGESPNTASIGQNAQLANENPAKHVTVRLQSTEQIGAVDAALRVTDHDPSRFSVFVDNTGNSDTGQARAGVGYQHANVFNRDHVFTAQLITSPTEASDVMIVGAGYRVPLYGWSAAVDVFAGYSDVDSGTVQGLFNVSGSGTIMGARYTQVLPRIDTYEHKLAVALDYRDFRQNVTFVGASGTLVPDITIHPLALTYSGRMSRVGTDLSGYVAVSQNIPGGQDGDQAAFTAQRTGAEARYTILRFGAIYARELGSWLARAIFSGQFTDDLLVPGEQFGMGGADSVRGFYEREAANDRGGRFTTELYGPDLGASLGSEWRLRGLAFLDAARGRDNEPARGVKNSLGSVGIGARISHGRALFGRLDWAYVVDGTGTRPDGADRFHFALGYNF